jgi:chromosome segregation ATPase
MTTIEERLSALEDAIDAINGYLNSVTAAVDGCNSDIANVVAEVSTLSGRMDVADGFKDKTELRLDELKITDDTNYQFLLGYIDSHLP